MTKIHSPVVSKCGLVLLAAILASGTAAGWQHAYAEFATGKAPEDAIEAQEKIKIRKINDKTNIEETHLPPLIAPQKDRQPTYSATSPSLYILWGYSHPCMLIFTCDEYMQRTWAPIRLNGASYGQAGTIDSSYPWIKIFYLLQGDLPGTYSGFRSTALATSNRLIYNSSIPVQLFEQYSSDPARTESVQIDNSGEGVPVNSQIFMQLSYTNYTPDK